MPTRNPNSHSSIQPYRHTALPPSGGLCCRPYGVMAQCTNVHTAVGAFDHTDECTNVQTSVWRYGCLYEWRNVQMAVCSFIRMDIQPDGVTSQRRDGTMYTRTSVQMALWLKGHMDKGTQEHTAYCPFIRMYTPPYVRTAKRLFGFSAVQPHRPVVSVQSVCTRKKNGKMCFCTYKSSIVCTKTTCHLRPVAAKTIAPKSQSDGIMV